MNAKIATFLLELADLMERHGADLNAEGYAPLEVWVGSVYVTFNRELDPAAIRDKVPADLRHPPTPWQAIRPPDAGLAWRVGRRLADGTWAWLLRDNGEPRKFSEAAARAEADRQNEPPLPVLDASERLTRDQVLTWVNASRVSTRDEIEQFLRVQGYRRVAATLHRWERDDGTIDLA